MYTHPLIKLLKTFSPKEMMWFNQFLNSPYFNKRIMMIKLFKVLRKNYPDFEGRHFTKEEIYKLLYKKTKYNDSTFRNLMSDLLKIAQRFLKQTGFEKKEKEIESSFFLTEELFNRGEYSLYLNQINQIEKILDVRNVIDDEYLFSKYKIETGRFSLNLLLEKTIKKSIVTTESENLIRGIVYFICYFVIESLTRNTILFNYSNTYNIKKSIDTISDFLELFEFEKINTFISKNSDLKVPLIELYFKQLKAFVNIENEDNYFDFKKSLLQHSKQLGRIENYFLHQRLIDYCVTRKTSGIKCSFDIDREIFELQTLFVNKEYYKTNANSYLPFDLYRNILLNCITVKELNYMEEFIVKNSKKIIPDQITNVENYSYAILYFQKGLYSKALNCLNKVVFDQSSFKIDMKNLQLKINYELKYYESAISIIDTYKHFINNNQLISENRKSLHNKFLSYTLQIIHFNTRSRKINLSFLESKIRKSNDIFDKEWLLEKIGEIEKNGKSKIKR